MKETLCRLSYRSGMASLVIALLALPLFGNTLWTVINTNDSGGGSLRDAIASASSGDVIQFDLSYPATITVATPLTFGPSVTITGPGASNLTISGADNTQPFIVNAGATVEISGLTVAHGSSLLGGGIFNAGTLTLDSVTVTNCTIGNQLGGGIFSSGSLTLNNSHVDGNVAGAVGGETGVGGGIYNYGGTLTITNSTVSNNSAIAADPTCALSCSVAGGIYNHSIGNVVLGNSNVSGNFAGQGGGILSDLGNQIGTVTITNSTISGNSTYLGGNGIYNLGTMTITGSTISGNFNVPSPSPANSFFGSGGGILNVNVLTILNSTIWGNSAGVGNFDGVGGGITSSNFYPTENLTMAFVTIAGNTGGGLELADSSLTMKNSILANNRLNGNSADCSLVDGPVSSAGFNLSDDATCAAFLTQPGDLNSTAAGVSTSGLANNGGPTQTVALVADRAIDAIPVSPMNDCTDTNGNAVTTDQRGVPRPQGPACDMGAFEFFQSRFLILAVQTYSLIDSAQTLPVSPEIVTELTDPLEAAVSSLNAGKTQPATGQLGAFVNTVHGLVLDNTLTPQQASPLTTSAEAIIQSIGH